MREAVIVSIARTGIGKALRGSPNRTHGATIPLSQKIKNFLENTG